MTSLTGLMHPIPTDKFGWGYNNQTITERHTTDRIMLQGAINARPAAFTYSGTRALGVNPEIEKRWDMYQVACGRGPGSQDLTIVEPFVFKNRRSRWYQQDGGTCVWSNTYRVLVWKMISDILFKNDPEEYFGLDEFGPESIAPHAMSYGFARQLANMRGPDGLYCGPMGDAIGRGLIMCRNPKLIEVMTAAGAGNKYDFPEPRNLKIYRAIGDWKYNDVLRPYLDCKVTDTAPITNIDMHLQFAKERRVGFQCSGIAIRARGKHKDDFVIHERDTNNSWPHNMGWGGFFYASDGTPYLRLSNLSWLFQELLNPTPHTYSGTWDDLLEKYIYNLPADHVKGWYDKNLVDTLSVGDIDMPKPVPPSA